MSLPLLSTKHHIPPLRASCVSRPRLQEKLLAGVKRPGGLVLLSGPAGFGKTTLLTEAIAGLRQPAAWLSLDQADNDPIRFWMYLLAACQSVASDIGQSALALLQVPQPLPDETLPTILINDIDKSGADLVLVLDDYQVIQNQSIHAALAFLLEHLPDTFHLVISTRVDPPWPLARFRARGQLVEIRAADLRFTTEEAAAFLNQVMELNLSGEDIAALEVRTEGWIASLQLAALSMKGRSDISGFIQAFTGSHVYVAEYLIEEVLVRQTDHVKDFLLQTSIFNRMNASLCNAVTGRSDSETILKNLCQSNLFVISLDEEGQWFRYHHLFADLLRARLPQNFPTTAIAALHRRAAAWYEQAGLIHEAIEHAQAAPDPALQVRLVENAALPMLLQAYVRTVEDWFNAIPVEYLDRGLRINMAHAWLHLVRGAYHQATPYVERLQAMFSAAPKPPGPSLRGEWLTIQSRILAAEGRSEESRDLAVEALEMLPASDAFVRSMALANLASAYQQMLDYEGAVAAFRMLVREAQASGNFALEILGTSGEAQMLLQQGRLHLAYERASQGIRRLEATGQSTPFSATLYGELGQIHYSWRQLDEARDYLLRSMQKSGQTGYSDPEIYHHITLSRIHQMEGDWDASAEDMRQAGDLARRMPPAMVREELVSQQVRVDLAFGRIAAAQTLLQPDGFHFDPFQFPELAPGSNVTHPVGLLYNSALRVLLHEAISKADRENLQRGIELAGQALAGEMQCRHIPIALETLLLRSQLYAAAGRERESLVDLTRALELGEEEGFISIFVEQGQPIAAALTSLLQRELPGNISPDYVRTILVAFPGKASSGVAPAGHAPAPAREDVLPLIEPLTAREMEVLQCIAAGDSNQTIADQLVITLSAVKKHTGNIFRKLNVNSRTQAIVRARLLGLLFQEQ